MNIPVLVLFLVFVLIAARRIGSLHVQMWQAVSAGAFAVLVSGQITVAEAWSAIDGNVIAFLFGMFVVGQALLESGYLNGLAHRVFSGTRSVNTLVGAVILFGGLASAVLMNDTLAIMGTPLVLRLAREHGINPRLMLFALLFAITTGSVMSPIGNPQNLLIATGAGMAAPFATFLHHLALPTLINLALAYGVLRLWFPQDFMRSPLVHTAVQSQDPGFARLARTSLLLVITLVVLKALLVMFGAVRQLPLSWIALIAAAPLMMSTQRWRILRHLDWSTLVFFASLFVLVESVWQTGFFQDFVTASGPRLAALPSVMTTGVLLSQFISNVPLVALYLPLLQHADASTTSLMALAAGSTIAGNLLVLGAASNVIVIQRAERDGVAIGFLEFARIGVVVTALNVGVYYLFLR